MRTKIQMIHDRAVITARAYLQSQAELIDLLQQLDELKGYREFECRTLHEYAQRELGLSSDVAYTLIGLARKSQEVPALKEKLQNQQISVSNARMIKSILTPENQEIWLQNATVLSKRELELALVKEFPQEAVQERIKPVAENRHELRLGISDDLNAKLRRLQDLLSQKLGKPASLEETLEWIAGEGLEKNDPVRKAERAELRKLKKSPAEISAPVPKNSSANRKALSAALVRSVDLRDRRQCTHLGPDSRRCQETRWLDYHHIMPVSEGGLDVPENIVTLCRGHHQLRHYRTLPIGSD